MASSITRFNIEKLDENIAQKHGGSKQVGLKQLGSKQVSNDDTAVAQRRSEDKQPEEKTNTDYLVNEQEKEYQTGWKIKMGNGEDTTMSTYLVTRSPSSAIGFKTPIDMFGLLVLIKGCLNRLRSSAYSWDIVKVRVQCRCCIDLSLRWNNKDHTFEVEPQENVDQGPRLQEAQTQDLINYQLARDREQHLTCKLFGYREDSNEAAFVVAAVEKIYAHESLTFNDTVACEVISKWKVGLKDDMDARSDVYALSNGYRK
ncbi:hypothetical protein Tco_1161076, partial [Tanacetum coccineum]